MKIGKTLSRKSCLESLKSKDDRADVVSGVFAKTINKRLISGLVSSMTSKSSFRIEVKFGRFPDSILKPTLFPLTWDCYFRIRLEISCLEGLAG